jgi:hypothetical protein
MLKLPASSKPPPEATTFGSAVWAKNGERKSRKAKKEEKIFIGRICFLKP